MRITRVYADSDGESHFEDRELSFEEVSYGLSSQPLPASALVFRQTEAGASLDFHNPPRRQFILFLRGEADLEASDGSTRHLGPGDVLLAEDTAGRGHRLREIVGRLVAFVPVPDEFDVDNFLGIP